MPAAGDSGGGFLVCERSTEGVHDDWAHPSQGVRQRHQPCTLTRLTWIRCCFSGKAVAGRANRRHASLLSRSAPHPTPSPERAHGDLGGLTATVLSPQAEGRTSRPRWTPLDTGGALLHCVQGLARCSVASPEADVVGDCTWPLFLFVEGTLAYQRPAGARRAEPNPDSDPCRPARLQTSAVQREHDAGQLCDLKFSSGRPDAEKQTGGILIF